MLRDLRWIAGAVIVFAVGAGSASAQTTCDRACLRTMLDQYLAAVVKHDPAAAPLVVGFRQTENAINVRPGNGVWKSVTGLGKVQRRYLDATSGQAACLRHSRGGQQHRHRDRARARREQATHRSGVVYRSRRRSRPQWTAATGTAAGQSSQPGVPGEESAARAGCSRQPANGSRGARAHRQQLLRCDHVARRLGCADASRMRSRRERFARAGGTIPAAEPTGDATVGSGRRAAAGTSRRAEQRLCLGPAELQRSDGRRATDSARGRRGAGRARLCRLHPSSRIADAAQRLQRVVLHRRGKDSNHLHGDVLSVAGARGAELAALQRQLAAACGYDSSRATAHS